MKQVYIVNPELVKAYEAGKTVSELAAEYGVSNPKIRRALRGEIPMRDDRGRAASGLAKRVRNADIIKLRNSGMKLAEIADMHGVSRQRIHKICEAYK